MIIMIVVVVVVVVVVSPHARPHDQAAIVCKLRAVQHTRRRSRGNTSSAYHVQHAVCAKGSSAVMNSNLVWLIVFFLFVYFFHRLKPSTTEDSRLTCVVSLQILVLLARV